MSESDQPDHHTIIISMCCEVKTDYCQKSSHHWHPCPPRHPVHDPGTRWPPERTNVAKPLMLFDLDPSPGQESANATKITQRRADLAYAELALSLARHHFENEIMLHYNADGSFKR